MRRLRPVVLAVVLLAAAAGTILYLASYFYGILIILGAAAVYAIYRARTTEPDAFRRQAIEAARGLAIPVAGIAIAIAIGAAIMAATGYDPLEAYAALLYGGFVRNWHVSLLNAAPLLFTGLSVAFAFKAGLFNIGAEGQYYVGAMVAVFCGIYFRLPPVISLVLIFFASALAACLYNVIPAVLKVKTGAHEVITTMMFAHIARYSSSIFIRNMGGDPDTSTHPYVTDPILESNWLPTFKAFLPEANYRLHIGIALAIVTALLVFYILYHTKFGFEIRAVGQNPEAARSQGISPSRNILRALLFAGFLAGLAGYNQVIGLDHKLFENLSAGYGWNGISVALLASNHPIGVIFTSILWGALDAGGQYMARTVQTPNSVVEIIKGIILFLVVARYLYAFVGNRIRRWRRRGSKPRVAEE